MAGRQPGASRLHIRTASAAPEQIHASVIRETMNDFS